METAIAFGAGIGIAYGVMKWYYEHRRVVWYDQEELVEGCTVQILENSETGETSIGWWRGTADEKPML